MNHLQEKRNRDTLALFMLVFNSASLMFKHCNKLEFVLMEEILILINIIYRGQSLLLIHWMVCVKSLK